MPQAINKSTWAVVVGPLGEYLMQENFELYQLVSRTQKQIGMANRAKAANTKYWAEQLNECEQELIATRQQLAMMRMRLAREKVHRQRANMKKQAALRLMRSVNEQNKRFQMVANVNDTRLKLRAVPKSFIESLEEDSDSDTGLSDHNEDVENPDNE